MWAHNLSSNNYDVTTVALLKMVSSCLRARLEEAQTVADVLFLQVQRAGSTLSRRVMDDGARRVWRSLRGTLVR